MKPCWGLVQHTQTFRSLVIIQDLTVQITMNLYFLWNLISHFELCHVVIKIWFEITWSQCNFEENQISLYTCFDSASIGTLLSKILEISDAKSRAINSCYGMIETSNGPHRCAVTVLERSTHWGQDEMAEIFQTTFWNEFSWIKMFEFQIWFHWIFF